MNDRASCPGCNEAAKDPASVIRYGDCMGCDARALLMVAQDEFDASQRGKSLTAEYTKALQIVFGKVWKEGHEFVKYWDAIIKGAQK